MYQNQTYQNQNAGMNAQNTGMQNQNAGGAQSGSNNSGRSNRTVVPEAKGALNHFRYL